MPTVDFKPLATDGAANVVTQAAFLVLLAGGGALEHGFQAGTAESDQCNKVWRQSSIMSAAIANFVANTLGEDVLDDGNLAALIDKVTRAVQNAAWTTGDMKPTMKVAADVGWVMMGDGTIGSGASTADYANNNAQALFTLLWNNTLDGDCPVVGGRGGSAAADWAANKKITLPQTRGRSLAGAGNGAGLTPRTLGATFGEEGHALTGAENGPHTHDIVTYSGGGAGQIHTAGAPSDANVATESSGAGTPHNTMQPTTFVNWMIKL